MTLKEIYEDCTRKNRLSLAVCVIINIFWIALTWNSGDENMDKYMVLTCGSVIFIILLVERIKDQREFRAYQFMYDFETIEKQMTEENTLAMSELHFYVTRDYVVGVNGSIKILKRNSILKIEEKQRPRNRSNKCDYEFVAHQMQENSVAFLHIRAPKKENESEELMQARRILKQAFRGSV